MANLSVTSNIFYMVLCFRIRFGATQDLAQRYTDVVNEQIWTVTIADISKFDLKLGLCEHYRKTTWHIRTDFF